MSDRGWLMVILRYDADLYEASTAERLLDDFETVAGRVAAASVERRRRRVLDAKE